MRVIAWLLVLWSLAASLPSRAEEKYARPASSLMPVSAVKDGSPAELADRLRRGFGFPNALSLIHI